mmetsp:Transcript_3731/g.9397  ORF Transcript_3731/g.9397 Transcript_3731/m.9397 type:complete len:565 (-) Transcript_3731:36-1730(-)
MSLQDEDFLPTTRTIRYRTDDPVQSLRIKVVMRSQEGDDTETQWLTKERVFTWQEKVFGPAEFARYKGMLEAEAEASSSAKGAGTFRRGKKLARTPLEERYCSAMDGVPAGEPIFTYVDADPFQDLTEYVKNVTTSPYEKPTPLSQRMMNVEEKRGRYSDIGEPFKMMYIMAEVKGMIDVVNTTEEGPVYVKEEQVLCSIKAYNNGVLDLTPGFSPKPAIKVDVMKNNSYKQASEYGLPYRLYTASNRVYEYWIINETEPKDASVIAHLNTKELRFQQDLFDKTHELRRNFVGDEFEPFSDSPDIDAHKVMLNMEIMCAENFDLDHLYVQYLLDIPEGWATGDAPILWGNTQVSRVKHINEGGRTTTRAVAHFGMPVEVTLWKAVEGKTDEEDSKKKEAKRVPCMLLQVNSYDQWDRQRVQGYGHINLPLEPGSQEITISTWRPALTQIGRMRSFFIGGTPELRDLTFAGVPTTQQGNVLSRYGFSTESSGHVRIRAHCAVQGAKPVVHTKVEAKAKDTLRSSAQAVADAVGGAAAKREAILQRARQRIEAQREAGSLRLRTKS